MNTCDTCKWWGVENDRACLPEEMKTCRYEYEHDKENSEPKPDSIFAWGYDQPQVATGPKFGCVHCEPK